MWSSSSDELSPCCLCPTPILKSRPYLWVSIQFPQNSCHLKSSNRIRGMTEAPWLDGIQAALGCSSTLGPTPPPREGATLTRWGNAHAVLYGGIADDLGELMVRRNLVRRCSARTISLYSLPNTCRMCVRTNVRRYFQPAGYLATRARQFNSL